LSQVVLKIEQDVPADYLAAASFIRQGVRSSSSPFS
jgi:hypothetical protein